MKFMTEVDAKNSFFKMLKEWRGESLVKNIMILEKEQKIQVMWDKLDYDADSGEWDGTLFIKITKIKMDELVNYILGHSRADEMSIDKKVLRLWWD